MNINAKTIGLGGTLLIAFLAGVLAGVGLSTVFRPAAEDQETPPRISAADPAGGAKETAQIADLKRRQASLERQIAFLKNANTELLDRLRETNPSRPASSPALSKPEAKENEKRTAPSIRPPEPDIPRSDPGPLIGADLSISEETAADKYTEYERRSLERILAETREKLDRAEAEHIRLVSRDSDKVVLQITPFYEDGEIIARELRADVELLLGEERSRDFLEVLEPRVRSHFSGFGSLPQQVTINELESGGFLIGIRTERPTLGKTPVREYKSHFVGQLPNRYRDFF